MIENSEWIIPILSAIGGAIVALIGREIIEWWKRPKLNTDFEERAKEKPYIPDFHDNNALAQSGIEDRVKYLCLFLQDSGKRPAMNCEAKLEVSVESGEDTNKVTLHWSRNDPLLYSVHNEDFLLRKNSEKIFAPISFNVDDKEPVDVFQLPYMISTRPDSDHSPKFRSVVESTSLRQLELQLNVAYKCKVTIYSSNTSPASYKFKVHWDGTLDGLNKAFTKEQSCPPNHLKL